MSHPFGGEYRYKCNLCGKEAFDAVDFEAGNNAEIPVSINLCDQHFSEQEKDFKKFMDQFGGKIDELAYDKLNGQEGL